MKVHIILDKKSQETPLYILCGVYNSANKFSGFVSIFNKNGNEDFYFKDGKKIGTHGDGEEKLDSLIKRHGKDFSTEIYDFLEKNIGIIFDDGYLIRKGAKYKVIFKDGKYKVFYSNSDFAKGETPVAIGGWTFNLK